MYKLNQGVGNAAAYSISLLICYSANRGKLGVVRIGLHPVEKRGSEAYTCESASYETT